MSYKTIELTEKRPAPHYENCIDLSTPGTISIYLLRDKDGMPYVGQSDKNLPARWKNGKGYAHNADMKKNIKEHGWGTWSKTLLRAGLSPKAANAFEDYYITLTHSLYPNGYNYYTSGNRPREYHGPRCKPVIRIDPDTGEETLFRSAPIAERRAKELDKDSPIRANHIRECVRGLRKHCGGYEWKAASDNPNLSLLPAEQNVLGKSLAKSEKDDIINAMVTGPQADERGSL